MKLGGHPAIAPRSQKRDGQPGLSFPTLSLHYKSAANKLGETGKLHTGAVTFVQRFGSSLNVHVHLHTCTLDGVYVEEGDEATPRFVPAAPPSRAELYVLAERVALRVMRA